MDTGTNKSTVDLDGCGHAPAYGTIKYVDMDTGTNKPTVDLDGADTPGTMTPSSM
jgi:hypothetical protein